MKYALSIYTLLMLSSSVNAQTTAPETPQQTEHSFKSAKGHEVLPQCGDWGLGISATGFLNYVGNMFNSNTFNTVPAFNSANTPDVFSIGSLGGVALTGKYMKSSTLAYRGRFQVNAGSNRYLNPVLKSTFTPDPLNPQFVNDEQTINSHVVLLGAGFEKRRGHGRVQGFYGAELLLGTSATKWNYDYGNAFTVDFTTPLSTTDFLSGGATNTASRTKERFTGNNWLAGLRGFVGVEYFIASKMSLGGEIGYTLGFSTNTKGYTVSETWNSGELKTATITTDTYRNDGLMSWGIGLDNINAGINFNFYF
jgi:hypothetical protein